MDEHEWLAKQFEAERPHLRSVAYRMLGDLSEAEDAVQESWLHFSRSDTSGVKNLGGWLTTVVARVCLDMLRSRNARREEPLEEYMPEPGTSDEGNPEDEALLADSVGLALLVVLDMLSPAERLAFVLHDLFAVSFDEIAPIVGRSETATRQLASRARRRVQGAKDVKGADVARQQEVVEAFLAASRSGDFDALLAVLDPEVVLRSDGASVLKSAPAEARGASTVARLFAGRARGAQPALVNGSVGIVAAPRGQLLIVFRLTITGGKIVEIDAVADPARLGQFDVAILGN